MGGARFAFIVALFGPLTGSAQTTLLLRDGQTFDGGYAGTRDVQMFAGGLYQWHSDGGYGSDFLVQMGGDPFSAVGLFRWDVSSLPPGTAVSAATVRLTIYGGSLDRFQVYECLRLFDEAKVNWYQASGTTAWSLPGAQAEGLDRGATVLADFAGTGVTAVVPLDDAGVDLVNRWLGGAPNYGVVVQNLAATDAFWVYAAEAAQSSGRPQLVLTLLDGGSVTFQQGQRPTAMYVGAHDATIVRGPDPQTVNWDRLGLAVQGRAAASGDSIASLLAFDATAVPPGARVLSGAVRLQTGMLTAGAGVRAYAALRPWAETAASWASFDGVNAWQAPGAAGAADRGTAVLFEGFRDAGPAAAMAMPLTDAGLLALQQWVDAPASNHGFILVSDDVPGLGFPARNATVIAQRPGLELVFEVPDAGARDAGPVVPDAGALGPVAYAAGCGCGQVPAPELLLLALGLLRWAAATGRRRAARARPSTPCRRRRRPRTR